jgi:hypothetical protein
MKLPELSASAAPQFTDPASAKGWLDHVPLANTSAAQQDLLGELEVFNKFPTATANRLAVMEALREAVSFIQVEQAKRFTNRALPMTEADATAFEDTIELWEQMRVGYLRCLEAALAGESGMRGQAALLTQRLGAYSGLKMFHHYRAYREVPPRDWRSLHEVYACAEKLRVTDEPVKDVLNRDVHDSSPRIAYARAALMGMCNPQELGQRQLTFVAFLLERWASKLEISKQPVPEGEGLPPLVVDLAGERMPERAEPGAAPAAASSAELRYLDTRKLAKSLRNRVGLLRKGESPARLALGEDCIQPSCEQTLVFLFRQWCQPKTARSAKRRQAAEMAQVTNDLEAIHHYISDGTSSPRRHLQEKELTQTQRLELETLGRVRTVDRQEYTMARGFALETWRIEDDSAQGMQIVRAAGPAAKRYGHGQLVAVRPSDAPAFILGQVRWLMQAAGGELRAGVKLMPGVPAATSLRAIGLNEKSARPSPALAIGEVPALKSPATLIVPSGWFKPKRVLEIQGEKPYQVRLTEVVERGIDFERVAYERA